MKPHCLAPEFKNMVKPMIPKTKYNLKEISPRCARSLHRNYVRSLTAEKVELPDEIKKITDETVKKISQILARKASLRPLRLQTNCK
jgi:hypothetical protein